ncbi:Flotillin-1 [Chionoecetes opilio]|uniref:Flotillin-1 n=1 Tax=Chionoecetes opilio TaxID=41210 RepID=A0A8J4Y6L9_CHIOP|nr:Flotillin-1 [Chionoecetes opilio]
MIPIFITCGPSEVLVVSGVGYSPPAMITGGRLLVVPCFNHWDRLSLKVMTISIDSPGVYTIQGVALKVTGVAQVKISTQHPDVLAAACENFLGKKERQIEALVTDTLEGHQRGIMGTMTVEDIYRNRKLFNERVFEVASKDLYRMGLHVISYTIRDLNDSMGYLEALGKKRTAEIKRDAVIGEAEAKKDAVIEKCIASEELLRAKFANDTLVAKASRDFQLKKALYDQEVQAKQAETDLAYELQSAKTRQKIKEEAMETEVVERKARIMVAEQEIQRAEKKLDSTIKQPAAAEKFRLETLAGARKQQLLLEAEAEAESKRLKGEAEALAIKAKANAEAVKMHHKAEAWKEFENAAILSMYLETLPKMVNRISRSLCQAKSIKMVSSGDSGVGAHKLTQEVMDISSSVPAMVKNMTGVDLMRPEYEVDEQVLAEPEVQQEDLALLQNIDW